MRRPAWIAALALSLAPVSAPAQEDLSLGQIRSPVLTIDPDRLLAETRFGQRLSEEIRAREVELGAENERLQAQLTAEEQSLTERRPTMEVEAFRAEAEAFDERVQRIRAEQDAKLRDLREDSEASRVDFLNAVSPVLARLMIDSGAAVILERRQVFLAVGLVEITDEAIAAIDEQIGDGTTPPAREGSQDPDEGDAALAPEPGETPAPEGAAPSPGEPAGD